MQSRGMVVVVIKTTSSGVKTAVSSKKKKLPFRQLRFGDTGKNDEKVTIHCTGEI